jgi:PIN domain-containing protein
MGEKGLGTRVLDAGALIAFEGGDERARVLLRRRFGPVVVPAPVLAQVWRDGARRAWLARFITSNGTVVEPLDELSAKAVGAILARSGTSDVVDASVVVSARRHDAIVLTTDTEDLLRIDPGLAVEAL